MLLALVRQQMNLSGMQQSSTGKLHSIMY